MRTMSMAAHIGTVEQRQRHRQAVVVLRVLVFMAAVSLQGVQAQYHPPHAPPTPWGKLPLSTLMVEDLLQVQLPDNISQTCNPLVQSLGLTILWAVTNGPNWYNSSGWAEWYYDNTTGYFELPPMPQLPEAPQAPMAPSTPPPGKTCYVPNIKGVLVPAPAHCCWYGVTCCTDYECGNSLSYYNCNCKTLNMTTALRLGHNNLTGMLPDSWLNWVACELKLVDFTTNHLRGNISSNISRMEKLEALGLGYNMFTGTLPPELGQLQNLQVLDFTANQLTGTIPPKLCDAANLTDILLASNSFNGNLVLANCFNLVQLDVTSAGLSGSLPLFLGWYALHILRLGNNSFNSAFNYTLASSPWLTDLDLSSNKLQGSIPTVVTDMRLLSNLNLASNQLGGSISDDFFSGLGMLTRVSLTNNLLTGTIPNIGFQLKTMVSMDMSYNYLTGVIPDSLRALALPNIQVNLNANWLSCCGINPLVGNALLNANTIGDVYGGVNWTLAGNTSTLLPSYLAFSQFFIPAPPTQGQQYSNMRCPSLRLVGPVDDASTALDWEIDPSYYMYYGCQCEGGYEFVNYTKPNRLPLYLCQEVSTAWYIKAPWILALIVVGATLIILAVLFLFCYRKGARPAFMQQYFNMRKRIQGEPRDGMVTIVTTDIEGYSDLMKREPELMGKGLRIHNYCIDKARWQFFGFTLEQEGDSFIIAFYEPFDAVAFCLQAQLLLQRVEWPEKLLNSAGGAERIRKGSMLTQAIQGAARMLMREGRDGRAQSQPTPDSMHTANPSSLPAGARLGSPQAPPPSASDPTSTPTATGPLHGTATSPGTGSSLPPGLAAAFSSVPGSATGSALNLGARAHSDEVPAASSGNRFFRGYSIRKKNSPSAIPEDHAVSTAGPSVSGPMPTESSGIRLTAPSSARLGSRTCVFNGLRVRMGVATGRLEKGMSLRSSAIMERSKVVSDAAAGGQVLMDGQTFREVKARLVELGAVDHNGLSLGKMNLSRPTLLGWMCGRRRTDDVEAVVALDMGKYLHKDIRPARDSFLTSPAMLPSFHTQSTGSVLGGRASQRGSNTAEQAATAAVASVDNMASTIAGQEGQGSLQRLHLYQVVSPVLVERARHFGSALALKDDWICIDQPYFSAPGAAAAALGLDTSSSIPAITMVFCMVDGAKEWKLKTLHDKARLTNVQQMIRDVLINTLMAVKGGYMCRLQEDEFKYMVAFPEPEDAAKWCLIMQDALMWQEWPEALLRMEKGKEERDERGEVVFRGPRLRMGLCHGVPRAIVPDHMGRADYHGASINSAARYMDAAAHGGQVVCEEETATAIIAHWNRSLRSADSTRSTGTASRLGTGGYYSLAGSGAALNAAPGSLGAEPGGPPGVGSPVAAAAGGVGTAPTPTPHLSQLPPLQNSSLRFMSAIETSSTGSAAAPTPSASRPASFPTLGGLTAGSANPRSGRPPIPPYGPNELLVRSSAPGNSLGSAGATEDAAEGPAAPNPLTQSSNYPTTQSPSTSVDGGAPTMSTQASKGRTTRSGGGGPGTSMGPSTDGRSTIGSRLADGMTAYDDDGEGEGRDSESVVWRDNILRAQSLARPSDVGGAISSYSGSTAQEPVGGAVSQGNQQGNGSSMEHQGSGVTERNTPEEGLTMDSWLQPTADRNSSAAAEPASTGGVIIGGSMLSQPSNSEVPSANDDLRLHQAPMTIPPTSSEPSRPGLPLTASAQHPPQPPSPFAPQYTAHPSLSTQASPSAPLPPATTSASPIAVEIPATSMFPLQAAALGEAASLGANTVSSAYSIPASLNSPERPRASTPPGILKVSTITAAEGNMLMEGLEGASPHQTPTATSMQKRPKASVRINVPETAERTSVSRMVALPSERDRPSNASSQSAATLTYRTAVSVLRLGGFVFKGSPDEIPIVQLLQENHLGRKFPSDPPKGKGGRTSVASGVVGVAPVVELPNIGRRYYWAYRALHQDQVPATPRGGSAIKGWAINLVGLSSRNSSHYNNAAAEYAVSAGSGMSGGPSTGRVTLSGVLGRSKNLLSYLRGPGSRNSRMMLPRASDGVQSEGAAAGTLPDTQSLPVPTPRRHTLSNGGGHLDPVRMIQLDHAQGRSDSISSFVDAAEKEVARQRAQEQQTGAVEVV